MDAFIGALKDTPLPTILVVAGITFWVLALCWIGRWQNYDLTRQAVRCRHRRHHTDCVGSVALHCADQTTADQTTFSPNYDEQQRL